MKTPTPEELEAADKLLANPMFMVIMGLVALKFCSTPSERPKYLKDCAPIHGRRAGAWRGKGSFGHGFGPQIKHK